MSFEPILKIKNMTYGVNEATFGLELHAEIAIPVGLLNEHLADDQIYGILGKAFVGELLRKLKVDSQLEGFEWI